MALQADAYKTTGINLKIVNKSYNWNYQLILPDKVSSKKCLKYKKISRIILLV